MAKWVVYENNKGSLTLLYRNPEAGILHNSGEMRSDTPRNMVVDWIVKTEAATPGDIIQLPSGVVFSYLSPPSVQV